MIAPFEPVSTAQLANQPPALNAYLGGLPTRRWVADEYRKWNDFLAGKGLMVDSSMVNEDRTVKNGATSVEWTKAALFQYGRDILNENVPDYILRGLDKGASGRYSLSNPEVSGWLNIGSQMSSVALSASPAVSTISSNLVTQGTVVIDAFADGRISEQESAAVGKAAGAAAGGIIGSIIPGIGTLLGSAVGGIIGGLFGGLFASRIERERNIRVNKETVERVQAAFQEECEKVYGELSNEFLESIGAMAYMWASAEAQMGYRFDLRWFDPNPGLRFERTAYPALVNKDAGVQFDPSSPNYIFNPKRQSKAGIDYPYGRYRESSCLVNDYRLRPFVGSTKNRWKERKLTMDCNFICPNQAIGCLYPHAQSLSSSDKLGDYGPRRVIRAIRDRGFGFPLEWNCVAPAFGRAYSVESSGERYAEEVKTLLENRVQNTATRFEIARKIVTYDIERTKSVVQSSVDLVRDQAQIRTTGVSNKLATAIESMNNRHVQRMEDVALYGGGALLLAALLSGRR